MIHLSVMDVTKDVKHGIKITLNRHHLPNMVPVIDNCFTSTEYSNRQRAQTDIF